MWLIRCFFSFMFIGFGLINYDTFKNFPNRYPNLQLLTGANFIIALMIIYGPYNIISYCEESYIGGPALIAFLYIYFGLIIERMNQ